MPSSNYSHWFVLGFAAACVLGSVEAIWAIVALRRWSQVLQG
jgi:hypothetical protein